MLKRSIPGLVLAVLALFYLLAVIYVDQATGNNSLPVGRVVLVTLLLGIALGWTGWQPSVSLALLWLLLGFHVFALEPFMLSEITALFVGFACAAWGSRRTLWLSLVSLPLAALVSVLMLRELADSYPGVTYNLLRDWGLWDAAERANESVWGPWLVGGVAGLLVLMVPWLLGLTVRLAGRSADSRRSADLADAERAKADAERQAAETARDAADEVARLQEGRAQLARDVHDVVGHSLTVILAQAEAGQYQQDPETLHRTLATITSTARSSLADIRTLLHATGSHPVVPAEEDLQALLAGVRASGREVSLVDVGQARPLPPDRAPVAHRVLQEMLTNAVRHGAAGSPIRVERHWAGDLRLEVTNALADPLPAVAGDETQPIMLDSPGLPDLEPSGHGVAGMRRRLDAVGGRLDCRRRFDPPTYTATAWLPLSGRYEVASPTETSEARASDRGLDSRPSPTETSQARASDRGAGSR